MPLVRIDSMEGRPAEQLAAIGEGVQRALVECLDVPARDQFQIVTEYSTGRLIYNSGYLGIERTDDIMIVQILLSSGCSVAPKQAFYARAAELISRARQFARRM